MQSVIEEKRERSRAKWDQSWLQTIALIATIVSAGFLFWLNVPTKGDIDKLASKSEVALGFEVMQKQFEAVDKRIEKQSEANQQQFDAMQKQFDAINERLTLIHADIRAYNQNFIEHLRQHEKLD
jgi:hypothetical protein